MSTYVLFFGGYHATQTDMDVWLASAKAQRPDVDFDAIPYPPGASSDGPTAVSAFTNGDLFDGAITQIGTSGAAQTYIVGHSSGCAIANALDRMLKDNSKINLVALDGFAPDAKQLARPSTQVWSAINGGAKSLNYDKLKAKVPSLKEHHAPGCTTIWALHFSLVNAAATDKIVTGKKVEDIIKTGYRHCKANLAWLK